MSNSGARFLNIEPSMVAHNCYLRTWEAEAGELLSSNPVKLFQKKKKFIICFKLAQVGNTVAPKELIKMLLVITKWF